MNSERAGNGHEKRPNKSLGRPLLHEAVTKAIIDAFFVVYNTLGYGFLESVYCGALALELRKRGHTVTREVSVPVFYDGVPVARYRIDFVVDGVVIVEVKSSEVLNPSIRRQLLNYLRATSLEVGLLLHFGTKPRFHRLVSPNN